MSVSNHLFPPTFVFWVNNNLRFGFSNITLVESLMNPFCIQHRFWPGFHGTYVALKKGTSPLRSCSRQRLSQSGAFCREQGIIAAVCGHNSGWWWQMEVVADRDFLWFLSSGQTPSSSRRWVPIRPVPKRFIPVADWVLRTCSLRVLRVKVRNPPRKHQLHPPWVLLLYWKTFKLSVLVCFISF